MIVRRILAGVLAVVGAGLGVFVFEFLGHQIWPPPADLDLADPAALEAAIAAAPPAALAAVAVAWGLGAFAGGLLGRFVVGGARWPAWLAGGFVLLGAGANLAMIPHPLWMMVAGPVAAILGGVAAGLFPLRR